MPTDYSAFCPAGTDVAVALAAGRALDSPGPGAFEAWVDTLTTRVQLAVLTAPTPAAQDAPLALSTGLKSLAEPLAEANYDPAEFDTAVTDGLDQLAADGDELATFLTDACDVDVATDAAVAAAVRELTATLVDSDVPATTVPASTVPTTLPLPDIDVDDAESGIRLLAPGRWTDEDGGTLAGGDRYLVRAVDADAFGGTDFGGEGVSIVARDDATDWQALVAARPHAERCTTVSDDEYDDGVYAGRLIRYDDCPGAVGPTVVVGAADTTEQIAVVVEIRIPSIDSTAIDTVLNSFYV